MGLGIGLGIHRPNSIISAGGGFVGLLDDYPNAVAAYSLRLLSSTYTGALVRIRRSSDNNEKDFYPDSNNELSLSSEDGAGTSISSWIGLNDGFVVTWYDQSGNANNASQASAASQPLIIDAGSLITENGKAGIKDLNSGQGLIANLANFAATNWNITKVVTPLGLDSNACIGADGDEDLYVEINRNGDGLRMFWRKNITLEEGGADRTNEQLLSFINNQNDTGNVEMYLNNSLINSGINTGTKRNTNNIFLFTAAPGISSGNVIIQEAIFWQADQTGNQAGIESNVNNHFSIY